MPGLEKPTATSKSTTCGRTPDRMQGIAHLDMLPDLNVSWQCEKAIVRGYQIRGKRSFVNLLTCLVVFCATRRRQKSAACGMTLHRPSQK